MLTIGILQGVTSIKDTTSFESQIFHQLEYPWCMQILVFGPKEHRKGGLFDSYFLSLEMPLPTLWNKIDGTQNDSFISCSPLKISMIGCPWFLKTSLFVWILQHLQLFFRRKKHRPHLLCCLLQGTSLEAAIRREALPQVEAAQSPWNLPPEKGLAGIYMI